MSALAKLMLVWEHEVSGSDVAFNSNVLELMELGAKVYVGIEKGVVEKADLVVYSASIKEDDVELNYARELKKRIIPRYFRNTSYCGGSTNSSRCSNNHFGYNGVYFKIFKS